MTNKQEKGCRARLIMGYHLAKAWSQCELRLKGACCKDCERLRNCQSPCSLCILTINMRPRVITWKPSNVCTS